MAETVSILVPVYNVEQYVGKCLDSLLAQTWKDIEIVLINDGSTDSSLQVCEDYAAKHSNIHIYSYPNSGISVTRNRALHHAQGEFVMFVDSDDFIDPEMVETMMEALHREKLDLVQCGFRMDYRFFTFYRKGSGRGSWDNLTALRMLAKGKKFNNYPWGKITRKSCFDGVTFPENMPGFEDTYTIFKSFANARRCGTIPNRFYHYVQRRGSLTNRMSLDTVYLMRKAYSYQEAYLKERFPQESFSFDMAQYNTDMVIIYTLIVFCHRKDHPRFVKGPVHWDKIPLVLKAAYWAWLGIAVLKLGTGILRPAESDPEADGKGKKNG